MRSAKEMREIVEINKGVGKIVDEHIRLLESAIFDEASRGGYELKDEVVDFAYGFNDFFLIQEVIDDVVDRLKKSGYHANGMLIQKGKTMWQISALYNVDWGE